MLKGTISLMVTCEASMKTYREFAIGHGRFRNSGRKSPFSHSHDLISGIMFSLNLVNDMGILIRAFNMFIEVIELGVAPLKDSFQQPAT